MNIVDVDVRPPMQMEDVIPKKQMPPKQMNARDLIKVPKERGTEWEKKERSYVVISFAGGISSSEPCIPISLTVQQPTNADTF